MLELNWRIIDHNTTLTSLTGSFLKGLHLNGLILQESLHSLPLEDDKSIF